MAALVLLASRAGAGSLAAPPVDPGSRIGLSLRTPFDDGTPPGACTIEITIRNGSRRDGAWEAEFETRSGYGQVQTTRQTMAVEAGASRTFVLIGLMEATGWSMSSLEISGPGVSSEPVGTCDRVWRGPAGSSPTAPSAPFAMSQSLAAGVWDALEQALGAHSKMRSGVRFDPAGLPADARAYAGLGLVFMSQDEWAALAAGTREAIQDWVSLGGRLWLLGPEAVDTRMGFGRVSAFPLPSLATMDQEIATRVLETRGGELDLAMYEAYAPWSLPGLMADPEPPRGLIFGFLLVVALTSGPLNLFWFARGRARHRVYWTTPLLSAGAAAAMGAFILAKDGTGGEGLRWTVVAVRPEAHRAAVVQEQVARTGLLFGSLFRSPDPLRMVPLVLERDWFQRGASSGSRETAGDAFSGWFRSRTRETHYLETVRPTRARVEVTRDSPPQVVSSLEGVLERLYVVDANGAVWGASSVSPGRRVTLAQADDYDAWFADILASGGPAGKRRLEALQRLPGYFYASAPGAAAIETLPTIRWKQSHLLYAGPVEALP